MVSLSLVISLELVSSSARQSGEQQGALAPCDCTKTTDEEVREEGEAKTAATEVADAGVQTKSEGTRNSETTVNATAADIMYVRVPCAAGATSFFFGRGSRTAVRLQVVALLSTL